MRPEDKMKRIAVCAAIAVVAGLVSISMADPLGLPQHWTFRPVELDIPNGGRGDTIAVHPYDPSVMIVASETGGLFRTKDKGKTWTHLDGLSQALTPAVAYLTPDVVLATARDDFRADNGGGIWRSADGGASWKHVFGPAAPVGVTERLWAREIAIAPDTGAVFVATAWGVARSTDNGITWTLLNSFTAGERRAYSIAALPGGVVLVAGATGVRRSTDGGSTWSATTTNLPGLLVDMPDFHGLSGAPGEKSLAFYVDGGLTLWASQDGGDTWAQIPGTPPGGGACGGIGLVRVVRVAESGGGTGLRLYHGNRCYIYRMTPTVLPGGGYSFGGSWTLLPVDHADTRDIAFNKDGEPILMATDGGLHRTTDGVNWAFTGGRKAGYNALQLTEVQAQRIGSSLIPDLYFGTQDNDLRASRDFGYSWPYVVGAEGFYIEVQPAVANEAQSVVTLQSCGDCVNRISGRTFDGVANWLNPPGKVDGAPIIVGPNYHLQYVSNSPGLSPGLAVTTDHGATWAQYSSFRDIPLSLAKVGRRQVGGTLAAVPALGPVIYQAIRVSWDGLLGIPVDRLLRIDAKVGGGGVVSYPLMQGFGGLGINPTMFAWYEVFAIDTSDPNHLLAPDVVKQQMMETFDGGDHWAARPDMTALATEGGKFRFANGIFSHVSAISFSPFNPNMVAFGTHQGGIFASTDRGATWFALAGSKKATIITSLEWTSGSELLVSTYGRGLWRSRRVIDLGKQLSTCVGCQLKEFPPIEEPLLIDPMYSPDPTKLGRTLVVLDGRLQGARLESGRLAEIFVTPGAELAWQARDGSDIPDDFDVTYSESWRGFQGGGVPVSRVNTREIFVGLAFGRRNHPIAALTAPAQLDSGRLVSARAPSLNVRRDATYVGSRRSPTADQPYLKVEGAGIANRIVAGEPVRLSALNLRASIDVLLVVDRLPVAQLRAGPRGELSARVDSLRQQGMHSIELRDARSGRVIDGCMVLVVHKDFDAAERNR
jgi:hypothetical protein